LYSNRFNLIELLLCADPTLSLSLSLSLSLIDNISPSLSFYSFISPPLFSYVRLSLFPSSFIMVNSNTDINLLIKRTEDLNWEDNPLDLQPASPEPLMPLIVGFVWQTPSPSSEKVNFKTFLLFISHQSLFNDSYYLKRCLILAFSF
jgi:hypothetical protein